MDSETALQLREVRRYIRRISLVLENHFDVNLHLRSEADGRMSFEPLALAELFEEIEEMRCSPQADVEAAELDRELLEAVQGPVEPPEPAHEEEPEEPAHEEPIERPETITYTFEEIPRNGDDIPMSAKFACKICHKRFTKETAYEDHLESEAHKQRVQEIEAKNQRPTADEKEAARRVG